MSTENSQRPDLNGLQRMMLRWEEFHPLNAAHVVELGERVNGSRFRLAVAQCVAGLGLRPVEFSPSRRSYQYFDLPRQSALQKHSPGDVPVETLQRPEFGSASVQQVLADHLNRPFDGGLHWPFRFVFWEAGDGRQYVAVVYQHAVSDSRGISLIVRQLLRTLFHGGNVHGGNVIEQLAVPRLVHSQLFPEQLGLGGWPRLVAESAREFWESLGCYRRPRRTHGKSVIVPEVHGTGLSTAAMKDFARGLGVTVQDALFAALFEAYTLLFAGELRRSRRKSLALYAAVDLRKESPVPLDHALTQLLGCLTVRRSARAGLPFERLAREVHLQTVTVKSRRGYLSHASQMEMFAWLWDCFPRWYNRISGPWLFPVMSLISNVNLSEFLARELTEGFVVDYFRFTGTGIMTPMMTGLTTVGPRINFTSTHHNDEFSANEVDLVMRHVELRLQGRLGSIVTEEEFRAPPPRSTGIEAIRRPTGLALVSVSTSETEPAGPHLAGRKSSRRDGSSSVVSGAGSDR